MKREFSWYNHSERMLPADKVSGRMRKNNGYGPGVRPNLHGFIKKFRNMPLNIASCRHHLFLLHDQAIEALAGVNEIVAFNKDVLIPEPVQCIPDRARRQGGLADEIFLGQLLSGLQYLVHKLCRRGQVPDTFCDINSVYGYDKNDPS